MLTMHELAGGDRPVLRYLDKAADTRPDTTRLIDQVGICDAHWRLPGDLRRARDVLAVLPASSRPADVRGALRTLVDRGVVAVALTPATGPCVLTAAEVVAAARGVGLPVLAPTAPADTQGLQARLLRRQIAALRETAERRDRLLRLSARLNRQREGPAPLLRYLESECDATVHVLEPADPQWHKLAEFDHVLTQVRHGQMQTAALSTTSEHIILHAVGVTAPHQVLAALRPTPWPRPLRDLVAQAAGQISLLQHPTERREAEHRLRQSERAIRVAILQYLMVGGVAAAVRAAEPLHPGVLTAEAGCLAVVECAPDDDRATVARECEAAVEGGRGLVVLCPAQDRHVIVLLPHPGPGPGVEAADVLRPVVRAGRAAGISTPQPWARTSRAYDCAVQALNTARQAPDRIAVQAAGTPLAALLPPAAHHWAAHLLRPLDRLPGDQRDQLLHSARLVLAYGAVPAGRLIGVDRTTAGRRLATVMECVGLNRALLTHRAVLDLAFQLHERPSGHQGDDGSGPPRLHALLQGSAAAPGEAERFLAPLDPETLHLLTTWLRAGGAVQETAAALGVHRNSVHHRLEGAAALLSRPLSHSGNGAHDLLWALVVTGRLPLETIPDPVADHALSES